MALAENWQPRKQRRQVRKDLSKLKGQIQGAGQAVAGAIAPSAWPGVVGDSAFASSLQPRIGASKREAIAAGVTQPDITRHYSLPGVPAFADETAALNQPAQATTTPIPALDPQSTHDPFVDTGSGYRIVQGPKGPILTNVGGDVNVRGQVDALRKDDVVAEVNVGGSPQKIRSTGGPINMAGILDRTKNKFTGIDAHGAVDRSAQGGNIDTLKHLRNVLMSGQPTVQGPSGVTPGSTENIYRGTDSNIWNGGGAISNMSAVDPTVMPNSANMPIIPAVNTFNAATAEGAEGTRPAANGSAPATGFIAASGERSAPITGGESPITNEQLQSLGAFMAEKQNVSRGAIPSLPTSGPVTYEDTLARGYGLAGEASGWAGAIARARQAHGYAGSQLQSINKNAARKAVEDRTSLGASKLAEEQRQFDALEPGRAADIGLKQSQTAIAKQKAEQFSKFTDAQWNQFLLGKSSKGAITDAMVDKRAMEIATAMSESMDPRYEGLSLTQLHNLASQELYDNIELRKAGKRVTLVPGQEKVSSTFGFGGSEATPATLAY